MFQTHARTKGETKDENKNKTDFSNKPQNPSTNHYKTQQQQANMSYEDPLFYHPSAMSFASSHSPVPIENELSDTSILTMFLPPETSISSDWTAQIPANVDVESSPSQPTAPANVDAEVSTPPSDQYLEYLEDLEDIFPSMMCPISQEIMEDPVVDQEGFSYERKHILRWLKTRSSSPVTRRRMHPIELRPNWALKNIICELKTELKVQKAIEGSVGNATTTSQHPDPNLTQHDRDPVGVRMLVWCPIPQEATEDSNHTKQNQDPAGAHISGLALCPISQEPMEDPVMDPAGFSYERKNILRWLKSCPYSPVTRKPMRPNDLRPNRALKNIIRELQNKPEAQEEPCLDMNGTATSKPPNSNSNKHDRDPAGVHINKHPDSNPDGYDKDGVDPTGAHIDELVW